MKKFSEFHTELKKNEILTQINRFTLILILKNFKKVQFHELQTIMNIIPGNLDPHLKILEKNTLILRKTKYFGKTVGSNIEITKKGEEEMDSYLFSLKDILQKFNKD